MKVIHFKVPILASLKEINVTIHDSSHAKTHLYHYIIFSTAYFKLYKRIRSKPGNFL